MSSTTVLPPVGAVRETAPRAAAFTQADRLIAPLLTAAAVMVLVIVAIQWGRSAGLVAALWAASGVGAGMWLRNARTRADDICFGGLIATGILAGEFLAGNSPALSAIFTAANMLEIITVVVLARWLAPSLRLGTVRETRAFLMVALLAPVPTAALVAVVLAGLQGADIINSFQTWWLGHAVGIAVIGCLALALRPRELARFAKPLKLVEAVGLLGLLAGIMYSVFSHLSFPVGIAAMPVLLLISARLRMLGVACALVIMAVIAITGSINGYGPYAQLFQGPGRAMMAQLLIVSAFMPVLLITALIEERDVLIGRAKAGQERAERASQAKSRLLANVAHEIKSPVSGVIGIGELWGSGQLGPVTPSQTEMAEVLVKTARQVEALSHDLLDVARVESGSVKVELRPTDVAGVLEDVRRSTAMQPGARALTLKVEVASDVIAMADSQRLTQIVANLASNAVKYGGSGGEVLFRAEETAAGVRIEVADKGPGLTAQKQAELFEPFNRLGMERSGIEGHGVGLALAKRLVELQGGSIGVESEPGQGATFWVLLPSA